MEDALVHANLGYDSDIKDVVLILVLMEDALVHPDDVRCITLSCWVLILVLMEDALVHLVKTLKNT